MNITDEMVALAAKAARDAKKCVLTRDMVGEFTRLEWEQARAALTAALGDVEPLEDTFGNIGYFDLVQLDNGHWKARTVVDTRGWIRGEGPTILDAIRAAVAHAKGGE